jgi:hypothetical protein
MNARTTFENGENQFGWLPDAWFCGAPDQCCRYCGRSIIFAPACLAIDACTCGATLAKTTFPARVKPAARTGAISKASAG